MMEHYKIFVDLSGSDCPPNAIAAISPSEDYDRASMTFCPGWQEETPFELNRVVVHELLHVIFQQYTNAIKLVNEAGVLSHQLQVVWEEALQSNEESVIDKLANRFVEIGGVVT